MPAPFQHYFVTGTDTAVGKTYWTAWLTRQWRSRGLNAAALKPISCGSREDARILRRAGDNLLPLNVINPFFYRRALAPGPAARLEKKQVPWSAAIRAVNQQRPRFPHLLVEGVGGWLVPLSRRHTVRDWAQELQLPVIIVARAGLGTLNHTLLTWESIRQTGLPCAGIILNFHQTPSGLAARTNPGLLRDWTGLPVFAFTRQAERAGQIPPWLLPPS